MTNLAIPRIQHGWLNLYAVSKQIHVIGLTYLIMSLMTNTNIWTISNHILVYVQERCYCERDCECYTRFMQASSHKSALPFWSVRSIGITSAQWSDGANYHKQCTKSWYLNTPAVYAAFLEPHMGTRNMKYRYPNCSCYVHKKSYSPTVYAGSAICNQCNISPRKSAHTNLYMLQITGIQHTFRQINILWISTLAHSIIFLHVLYKISNCLWCIVEYILLL